MGIFRISADNNKLEKFLKVFQKGETVDMLNEPGVDCHLTAALLKAYFRTLSEPIFPKEHHSTLLSVNDIDDNNEQINTIKEIIKTHVKQEDLNCLTHLFNLLNEVSKKSDQNLMPSNNIATCWSPTLFHSGNEAKDIVMLMIENCESIFGQLTNLVRVSNPTPPEEPKETGNMEGLKEPTNKKPSKRGLLVKMRRNSEYVIKRKQDTDSEEEQNTKKKKKKDKGGEDKPVNPKKF